MGLYIYSLFLLLPVYLCVWFIYSCSECTEWGREITKERELWEPSVYTHSHTQSLSHYLPLSFPKCKYILKSGRQIEEMIYKCLLFAAVLHCDSSPCGRGATCQETPQGFQCLCPPFWTGRTCQLGRYKEQHTSVTCPQPSIHVYTCLTWSYQYQHTHPPLYLMKPASTCLNLL